jgi:hypothetical protein
MAPDVVGTVLMAWTLMAQTSPTAHRRAVTCDNRRKRQHYRVTVSLVQQAHRLCTESIFFDRNDGATHAVSGNNPDR